MSALSTAKKCPGCNTVKPSTAFHAAARRLDGRQTYCKDCRSKAKKSPDHFTTYTRTRNGKTQLVTRRVDGHGLSKTSPLYKVWCGMRRRCNEPAAQNYRFYGGRGVTVCGQWDADFLAFRAWALDAGYEPGMELDRIDNERGYRPDNCRWVTKLHNLQNRRAYLPNDVEVRLFSEAQRRNIPVYALVREAVEMHLGFLPQKGGDA